MNFSSIETKNQKNFKNLARRVDLGFTGLFIGIKHGLMPINPTIFLFALHKV